jgi:protocatechuate 3,4-dioxygenase alpha subunit
MSALPLTPSQTVGPFLHIALSWEDGPFVVPEGTAGAIWLRGRILDGAGDPVPDGLVETWQADADGGLDHTVDAPDDRAADSFRGFGRCPTGPRGDWAMLTRKPGAVPGTDGQPQAPYVDVSVFARGLLNRLVTRIYFADETDANRVDPVLRSVPERRRHTVLAEPTGDGYHLDIRLQGEHETVFFAV